MKKQVKKQVKKQAKVAKAEPVAKPEPKAKPNATKVLSRVYDALCGVVSEMGVEFFDAFYQGGGEKMMDDIKAMIDKRREYARSYYAANREKLAEASRRCHAKKRAEAKAAKKEVTK